jgi:hypothetical protein
MLHLYAFENVNRISTKQFLRPLNRLHAAQRAILRVATSSQKVCATKLVRQLSVSDPSVTEFEMK